MLQDIIPQSFEETILAYLKHQEVYPGEFDYALELTREAEEDVKAILYELLLKVNKRIACRDRYENIKQWHHQYPLFDMNDYIPDFCIDDELFKKLSFRETLLISELRLTSTSRDCEPNAVGGLCLDVQNAEGHLPEEREKPVDAELDREVFQVLQRVKQATAKKASIQKDELERELQEKLVEYESFLRNEMKQNVRKFVVHVSSQFDVGGYKAGSRITAWVDRYFHTLEEKRTEYIIQDEDVTNEKCLYTSLQRNKYYLRVKSSLDEFEQRKYYGLPKAKELVCEGANFVLMRYLAIIQYKGSFELSTMYINGDMCRNIYECTGPTTGEVNGKTVGICKIYRYIIEECGIEHHCLTVLTRYGRIVTQEWEGCDYIININPLQYISEPPRAYQRLMLTKTWQDDMQLMSQYLGCKTTAEKKMKTYLADHPEIKDMVADYMQNILLLKPENILTFTVDYFQSLYPCKLARLPYLEPQDLDRDKSELYFFE